MSSPVYTCDRFSPVVPSHPCLPSFLSYFSLSTNGHCYFIEDGSEALNTFDGNLGVLAKPVADADPRQIIPTDDAPTMFWITNPNNTWTNNVASSARHCYWFSLPKLPNGLSAAKYAQGPIFPRLIPLGTFANNEAHGCNENGLMVDSAQNAAGEIELASYTPILGATSADVETYKYERVNAHFTNFVAWKCRSHGVWTRGSGMVVTGAKLLDNGVGTLQIPGPSFFMDSLVVGETANIGTPVSPQWIPEMGRSRPVYWTNLMPVRGIQHYDAGGPQFFKNVRCENFVTNSFRPAGCHALLRNGPNMLHAENRVRGMTYVNSNKVYLERWDPNPVTKDAKPLDGPKAVNWIDLDGTTTGTVGAWVVSDNAIMTQGYGCTLKSEWNAQVCPRTPHSYVQLQVENLNVGGTDFAGTNTQAADAASVPASGDIRATFYRLTPAGSAAIGLPVTGQDPKSNTRNRYTANVRVRDAYTVHFPHPTPPTLRVSIMGAATGEWVHVAIPYKAGTTFTVKTGWDERVSTQVNSLDQVVDSTTYYYDSNTEHLHLRIQSNEHETREQWGFVWHSSYATRTTITANCGSACGGGSSATPPNLPSVSSDQVYGGILQGCQMSPAVPTTATGHAYIVYNPHSKRVFTNIFHTLGDSITGGSIIDQVTGKVVTTFSHTAAPIQITAPVTYQQLTSLYEGKWKVVLTSSSHPNGELAAGVSCEGTCAPPPQIPTTDPCRVPSQGLTLAAEGVTGEWDNWSWGISKEGVVTTDSKAVLCGSKGLQVDMKPKGGFALHTPWNTAVNVDPSKYSLFEFWIKTDAGTAADTRFITTMSDKDGVDLAPTSIKWLYVEGKYISNFALGPDHWSRVQIPLADLGVTQPNVAVMWKLALHWTQKLDVRIFMDQVRFLSADGDSMSVAITSPPGKFLSGCQEVVPTPTPSATPSTGGTSTGGTGTGGTGTGGTGTGGTESGGTGTGGTGTGGTGTGGTGTGGTGTGGTGTGGTGTGGTDGDGNAGTGTGATDSTPTPTPASATSTPLPADAPADADPNRPDTADPNADPNSPVNPGDVDSGELSNTQGGKNPGSAGDEQAKKEKVTYAAVGIAGAAVLGAAVVGTMYTLKRRKRLARSRAANTLPSMGGAGDSGQFAANVPMTHVVPPPATATAPPIPPPRPAGGLNYPPPPPPVQL
eukprot:TRINITY_DN1162_c0_g1_i5.p1 TRINITY_DN1162_c0_g1~~TRINITY_DN1162_c0_g1_i5.p1  ORF type:complete len:1174 (-),score=271.46 TRINITY_DN1162_c0_g1_i5:72-3593(-)